MLAEVSAEPFPLAGQVCHVCCAAAVKSGDLVQVEPLG
jgi:hypothetical protein